MIENEKEKISAFVKLTDVEILERAKVASNLNNEIAQLTYQGKVAADKFKTQIGGKRTEMNTLLDAVKEGKEKRLVECEKVLKPASNTVEYLYQGEVVYQRGITDCDRQQKIPGVITRIVDGDETDYSAPARPRPRPASKAK